jgi:hypothetical protein
MQTSVKLQDMMSYSLLLTIIAIAVIVLPLILFAVLKFVKLKPKKKAPKAMGHGLPEGVYEGERLQRELKENILGHERRRVIFSRCMKLISRELITGNAHYLDFTIRRAEDMIIMVAALLDAGIPVTERHPHSLPVSYIAPGRDATIASPNLDLRFRNVYDYPLCIQSFYANGDITVMMIAMK